VKATLLAIYVLALIAGWAFLVCTANSRLVASAAIGPVFGLLVGYLLGFYRVRLTATKPSEGAE
jgi:membrane protein YqaA with SNARE-associated domain